MNLFWFCNDCSNIAIQNLKISRRLDSLEQKTNDVLEQTKECFSVVKTLYDRAPNASVQKWSDVVKAKRPPLIIKPKNSSQNSVKTKLDVTNKVDPSQINIAGVRNTANGGIQIECENDELMQKLHEAARNALADRYEIQIPEFKKPKIVIVGVYDKYLREIDIFINKLKDMCGTSEITFVRKYKPHAGFTQIVQEFTRVTNTSATLIDLIVTNNYLLEEIRGDFPQISDHRIIGCVLDVQHGIKTEEMKYKRKFNKENINTIIAELYGKDWDYSTTDVDLLYEKFMKNITETVNKVVPLENTQTRKQPWINRFVIQGRRDRDEA
ncbi:unnamed protein product [Acanthoscelides obtectus]|uniref:Uncharacterized protein n=1 Tax=Acanthoscelides obtectus TaxID=200917 RepID=A0A9P0K3J2_ACAOB|nr:unnamed protein product [Acanthoscelides obtectus]CAK1639509.1 hypothetical protein AOBTE_LOCUS11219 [Acanthoscelides obtectus]